MTQWNVLGGNMPKTIAGKPKDEEKWDKAEELAGKQGRGDDYAYIMGIYKRMMGLEKSMKLVIYRGEKQC